MTEKWLTAELDHTVSKVASDCFWKIAQSFIPKIVEAKRVQNITKKVPQFTHIRRKMYKEEVPEVNLEIGYRHKETSEISIVKDTVTPKSRYPPNEYENFFEIASVKVC